jgi:hypothetical protein
MKKTILFLSLSVALMLTGLTMAFAQEAPNPQKDTVNIDTDAKPTLYYATEDEKTGAENTKSKSPAALIGIIVGAVVIVGGVAMMFLKKKK